MTVDVSQACLLMTTEHEQLLPVNKPIVIHFLIPAGHGMNIADEIMKAYRHNVPLHAFRPAFLPESENIKQKHGRSRQSLSFLVGFAQTVEVTRAAHTHRMTQHIVLGRGNCGSVRNSTI